MRAVRDYWRFFTPSGNLYFGPRARSDLLRVLSLSLSLALSSPCRSLIDEIPVRESTRGKKHPVPPRCRNSARASASNSQLIRRFELEDASSRSTGPKGDEFTPGAGRIYCDSGDPRTNLPRPSFRNTFPSTREIFAACSRRNGWRVYRPKARLSRKREDAGKESQGVHTIAGLNKLMETFGKLRKFLIESSSYNVDIKSYEWHTTPFFRVGKILQPFCL